MTQVKTFDYASATPMIKKVDRKPLDFKERLYVIEVARGIAITSRHFFKNLALHTAHLLGLAKTMRAAATFQYPEVRRPLARRHRSRHRLTEREDGSPRCVACMMCETICPAFCIFIVAAEHPDINIEKHPARFDIDYAKCVFCGLCVEACPEDAIRMDTGVLELAASSRAELVYSKEQLLG